MATGGKPSLMVIILTDSLLSRFNKLNVPLYLHPGLPLKSVQQAYFTGFSAEVNARLSMLDLNDAVPEISGTILFREDYLNKPQTQQAVSYLQSRWGS